ncbi:MAG: hypothetical protein KY463_02470, partial [Actinobacteria bacterium]|nr:hypothetical protein [Actinomycetota bacterium]
MSRSREATGTVAVTVPAGGNLRLQLRLEVGLLTGGGARATARIDHERHRADLVVLTQVHQPHALRRAAV